MRFPWLLIPFVVLGFSCRSTNQSGLSSDSPKPIHLAIGDSIAFGYDPLVAMTDENVAAGKFVGYPEVAAEKLGYQVANTACTGETSASFVDRKARDNGCHSGDKPYDQHLKVEYTENQLDYAVKFLKKNPDTKLVTVTIGGNDILLVESDCDKCAKDKPASECEKTISKFIRKKYESPTLCKAGSVPTLLFDLAVNVKKIIDGIQGSGYKGPIVFVTQYARNYKDPIQVAALGAVQLEIKAIAKLKKIKVASGYDAFKKASADFGGDACKAGLMIALPDGDCNQHPSEKGREILGQAVVDALKL